MTQSPSSLDCDVIIVNFNAGKLLIDCVYSAFSSGATKVIVVDNGSTDGSLEHLEQVVADERLAVIRNKKNLGFAAACNIGARASTASRMLFLNPDSVLAKDALARMVEVLKRSEAAGMVGGLLCNPDGSEQPGGRRDFPNPLMAFMKAFGLSRLARFFPGLFSDYLQHNKPLPTETVAVEAISGACMLVKREAMDNVGLWDEGYFLHCEDLDWCMRFRLNGYQIFFVPGAKVIHAQGECSRSRPVFVEWHKHRGMLRFYGKFFREQYPAIMWPLVTAGVWMRFALVAGYFTARRASRAMGFSRG